MTSVDILEAHALCEISRDQYIRGPNLSCQNVSIDIFSKVKLYLTDTILNASDGQTLPDHINYRRIWGPNFTRPFWLLILLMAKPYQFIIIVDMFEGRALLDY